MGQTPNKALHGTRYRAPVSFGVMPHSFQTQIRKSDCRF